MEVPKAVNVAIIIGTEWTQLEQKSPGRWEAEVRQNVEGNVTV